MDYTLRISDFSKLANTTVKTVMYYHKIGLLQEPVRSSAGYRLYGAKELGRMRQIKHMKSLGLSLSSIREILGDHYDSGSLEQILQTLHGELLTQKKELEAKIQRVETLLDQEALAEVDNAASSDSFHQVAELLQPEQVTEYKETCPELFDQQNISFGILEDFQWGEDHQAVFKTLAEYFRNNPELFQTALQLRKRLSDLSQLTEDDPRIEILAREGAELIKSNPLLKELLYNKSGFGEAHETLYNHMLEEHLSPARMKHKMLMQQYLHYKP